MPLYMSFSAVSAAVFSTTRASSAPRAATQELLLHTELVASSISAGRNSNASSDPEPKSAVATDAPHTPRECLVCFEPIDALQTHECVDCRGAFCTSCMQRYVECKILAGDVSRKKLVCPAPDCVRPLAEDAIAALASQELFAKYQTFLKNKTPGMRFCPRAGCSAAIVDEPLFCRDRRVKCSACSTESCMHCGGDYHRAVLLCRRSDRRYGEWKRSHEVRACPSCASDIEKLSGCKHMSCFQCDQEFCWTCLRPWDGHNAKLCVPLTAIRKHGCMAPVQLVVKGVAIGVAGTVVVSAALGVVVLAFVVVPPIYGYRQMRECIRNHKQKRLRGSDADGSDDAGDDDELLAPHEKNMLDWSHMNLPSPSAGVDGSAFPRLLLPWIRQLGHFLSFFPESQETTMPLRQLYDQLRKFELN